MKKQRFFVLFALIVLFALGACSSNKIAEVVSEPEPTPLELARQAAEEAADFYESQLFEDAIGSFEKAIEYFELAAPKASERDSIGVNIEKMRLNIAKSHIDLGAESVEFTRYEDALQHYGTALEIYRAIEAITIEQDELDQLIIGTLSNLALVSKDNAEYEKALQYYDEILKYQPDNAEILNAKVIILKDDLQDSARAFQVLEDYAEAANDANAYILLGDNYAKDLDFAKAEIAFKKAEALLPEAIVYSRMANMYRANSQWDKSNVYLEKYLNTKPATQDEVATLKIIADNYSKQGNNAKRIEYLERSLALSPEPQLALLLASHYNGAKIWSKVVTYASMVLGMESSNADARMLRGVAYFQQKNNAAAKADLLLLENHPKYGAQAKNLIKNIK